jgi:hypothetical protein
MKRGALAKATRVGVMRGLATLVVVAALAGCASTSIRSAWFDPSYKGGPFKRILVAGISGSLADRRVFEDIFAQRLKAAGADGLPGYQFAPEDARASESSWSTAIAKSGADGLLMVQVLGVDTRTQVSTVMVPASPWGFGPYGGWWGPPAMVAVPDVYQFDVATIETRLFDVATKRLVWVGTTETLNPRTVAAETPGFADVIIGQLAARGLVPGAAK